MRSIATRITPDDEVVVENPDMVHIERMGDDHVWLAIHKGDQRITVNFHAAKVRRLFTSARLSMLVEEE